MKVAIVHDQLQEFGGAERVLVSLCSLYPDADIYTSFYNPKSLGIHASHIRKNKVKTSWADKIWFLKKLYSPLRFITPLLWESFDFTGYDLVISSSGSYMCKGIVTRPETIHICYLHHPPRYLYYYETAREWQKYWPVRIYGHLINHKLRLWDFLSSQRVDFFIANSCDTKRRIEKFYRRDATVIYPPVSIPMYSNPETWNMEHKSYYLTVSRLARAKHIDILIRAANRYGFHLKIVGSGRDESYLKSLAGKTVEFLGGVDDKQLSALYKNAKAYLFASVDDEFGIAPVEALGHGLPVIAYKSGGLKETITENENGYLFDTLSEESLHDSIKKMESLNEDQYKAMCKKARESSEQYSNDNFKKQIQQLVESKLNHARTT
jgi:glycosyltransferase involved in cell wall biosynthesis